MAAVILQMAAPLRGEVAPLVAKARQVVADNPPMEAEAHLTEAAAIRTEAPPEAKARQVVVDNHLMGEGARPMEALLEVKAHLEAVDNHPTEVVDPPWKRSIWWWLPLPRA